MPRAALPLLAACLLPTVAIAQLDEAATGASKPQPVAVPDTIPPPRDVAYPGTIRLAVDATDVTRGIFEVREAIPVAPGPLTLLYPEWLPGTHSPTGQISKLAGLVITAGGRPVPWRRDPIDVFAFHVDVPADAASIDVSFQYLSPVADNQGRIVATSRMLNLQWDAVALYPAGYFVRNITIRPSAAYPSGWTSFTALRPSGEPTKAGGTIDYAPVAFDTLIDSPTIAGQNARVVPLAPDVTLDILADRPDQLAATPEQIGAYKELVAQATRLFGARHYNHYDFLFTLSDRLGGEGLEHHRSSEDGTHADHFTDWDTSVAMRDLLPHEFVHSWNGKFRRPAGLWTPDYRTPMQDELLWVYEGQTQFWGNVLAARSGLVPKPDALDALANVVAGYETQAGRRWRPLVDTTNEPTISERRPAPWSSWQRGADYYAEGQLVWLDADSIIRERTRGVRSIDDFARAFFGMRDRDWGEVTYTFDDVVAALNTVTPYDWAAFLRARIYAVAPEPPLDWLARDGYRLVYTDEPGHMWKAREKFRKILDLSYSLGIVIGKDGSVDRVAWRSPAFDAGITNGDTIVAVDGAGYDGDGLKRAITEAKGGTRPITLLLKRGDAYRTVSVNWAGGLRYPHLERAGTGPVGLDKLYAPRAKA